MDHWVTYQAAQHTPHADSKLSVMAPYGLFIKDLHLWDPLTILGSRTSASGA